MNEPLQQSTAQGLNEADPAKYLTTRYAVWLACTSHNDTVYSVC